VIPLRDLPYAKSTTSNFKAVNEYILGQRLD